MSDAQIVELETLRRQLQQLHELFAVVIDETRPTPDNPAVMPWPELLSKFNVLAGKYAILSQTVGRKHASLLKELAVVPRTQPTGIHEQNIMSVLLRTKLAPEIEQEEEEIWAQVQTEAQQVQRHESLAITAMNTFSSLRKSHPSRVYQQVQAAIDAAPAQTAVPQPDEEPADKKAVSLEEILAFASAGAPL
ncbi:hypothetical protein IWW55_002433 [Coemansia sp. RSA 2706]|nr:hypothetical protein LPJ63_002149 [Coemansia sp. RSA 2711]KAJ2304429.1 hypothetical protein IWW55_002433 [Coemansia sp. RSA 2706]KAJ2311179.1 hypothetical protein IWW54_002788 [Coemansia sp. RSA 2705]KAJ2319299.1 hypothetical protein IWW52_002056 [Coemansia sp. RSA 2704]KAJ2326669.1 hypothetical protein IWW51_002152 [Coemansia sp. RSA 2702]KAJ2363324.1 hypothetical protein H4S01_004357 [Coemansia sp. RSA 2610]